MKVYISIFGICILMFAFQDSQAKKLNIITSLPSLASITESIGGDQVEIYSITRGVQDAHYVEAKPSYMVKLNKADLLIYSGLELEIGWLPLLIQGARNNTVSVGAPGNLNASQVIPHDNILEKPRGEVDRTMGDVHPLGNPHYLLNPYNGLLVAELITDKLIELDPNNEEYYAKNLEDFQTTLKAKITLLENQASFLKNLLVVCYHVHWSYLFDWLGIKIAGYIELRPGIPPTPRHKKDIIELMKRKNIKLVVISSWKEPTKAQEVADEVGAELVILPGEVNAVPNSENYFSWLDYMVKHLIDAAAASGIEEDQNKQHRHRKHERGKND